MGDAPEFLEDNGNALISAQGHIGGTTFYHPKEHVTFDFDPITQLIGNIRPASSSLGFLGF